MVDFDELSDALKGEVMTEMADGFFGARREVDSEVEYFQAREADIRLSGQRALCSYALLHALLLDGEAAPQLFAKLGVDPAFCEKVQGVLPCLYVRLPLALTRKRRFAKLVRTVYEKVAEAFSIYLEGKNYTLPNSREHRRTIGYARYVQWCAEINERIAKVNESHAPSCVLGMARSMGEDTSAAQSVAGAAMDNYSGSLDASLCLKPVYCDTAGVGPLPALPVDEDALDSVTDFAVRLYSEHAETINKILKRLEHQQDCRLNPDT